MYRKTIQERKRRVAHLPIAIEAEPQPNSGANAQTMAVSLYQQQRAQEEEEEKPRGNIRELLISSIRILGRCNENISSRKRVSNIKSGI